MVVRELFENFMFVGDFSVNYGINTEKPEEIIRFNGNGASFQNSFGGYLVKTWLFDIKNSVMNIVISKK